MKSDPWCIWRRAARSPWCVVIQLYQFPGLIYHNRHTIVPTSIMKGHTILRFPRVNNHGVLLKSTTIRRNSAACFQGTRTRCVRGTTSYSNRYISAVLNGYDKYGQRQLHVGVVAKRFAGALMQCSLQCDCGWGLWLGGHMLKDL